MAANSSIEWTDHTFNPWIGCTKVGPGCDHCYAEAMMDHRYGKAKWGAGQPRMRTSAANWRLPLRWNAQAEREGRRYRVFCASLADVFDNEIDPTWRDDLLDLIRRTRHLDWLLLTKRIGNVDRMVQEAGSRAAAQGYPPGATGVLPPHVWLGATVVNQEEGDRDIPKLLAVPAAKRFLSIEPMLGPVDLRLEARNDIARWDGLGRDLPLRRIDWVICGGESGPHARPMHPDWARSLRDQCNASGVPFFFKQHGEWLPTAFCTDAQAALPHRGLAYVSRNGSVHDGHDGVDFFGGDEEVTRVGKKLAGRLLDGREWNDVPA